MSETTTARGTIAIPEVGRRTDATSRDAIDGALRDLQDHAEPWLELPIDDRIRLLDEMVADTAAVAERWVEVACEAKRIPLGSAREGEEWYGPALTIRNLRLLRRTLADVRDHGRPRLPGAPRPLEGGGVAVPVMPSDAYDRVLYQGYRGEVRLQPHVRLEDVEERAALAYRGGYATPGVRLVLGAGNHAAIPPTDAIYALYAHNQVVALKMNPVNDHLGPILAQAMRALVERGFLRIVYGGADEGRYLTHHDHVDSIHITGSDKTHDAIVFGSGEEGSQRKAAGQPVLDKPITSELGNVSPVIVVPGPWSDRDIAYHGRNLATMLTQNGGFNCIALRAIVTHRAWSQRTALLDAVRDALRATAPFYPYYPGAEDRWRRFVESHPEAERYGPEGTGCVPWTLIPDLDATADDEVAFDTEAFAGVAGEVPLDAPRSVADFLDEAVAFCNERLWGTLAASIIIHPRSLRDPAVRAAFDRAVRDLRYGSVVVNHWMALPFAVMTTSWGAYPGHDLTDIQSGRGVVHNTFLLEDVEKAVVHGPFRTPVDPVWFATHRNAHEAVRRVAEFEADPSWAKVPGIAWYALRDGSRR